MRLPRVLWAAITAVSRAGLGLAVLLASACGFGVPLNHPTAVPEQQTRSAALPPGSSPEAVRSTLGTPFLAHPDWGVEVYRSDDRQTRLSFLMAIVVPVPVGVFSERRHGHVLVGYGDDGRLAAVSAGVASDGLLAATADTWLTLRSGELAFVVDQLGNDRRTSLLAAAPLRARFLAARRQGARCTLVLGCGATSGCPDRAAVDDLPPRNPIPVVALCAPESCPDGVDRSGPALSGRQFRDVPVLHAFDLDAGPHRLALTSRWIKGGGSSEFRCAAGEVVYAIVASRAEGASFMSRGTLEVEARFEPDPPADWSRRWLVLHRDGHWLVPEPPAAAPSRSEKSEPPSRAPSRSETSEPPAPPQTRSE